jgi:hypothetical protein
MYGVKGGEKIINFGLSHVSSANIINPSVLSAPCHLWIKILIRNELVSGCRNFFHQLKSVIVSIITGYRK